MRMVVPQQTTWLKSWRKYTPLIKYIKKIHQLWFNLMAVSIVQVSDSKTDGVSGVHYQSPLCRKLHSYGSMST